MGPSRSTQVRSVTVVAVVALLLGALGTVGVSYAAGVTAKQAKVIAKKVVKKQAKKLSVKNAKQLNGKPASAYQDAARVYYTTVSTPEDSIMISIPGLSPGKTYQVSYYAFMDGAPSGGSACFMNRRQGPTAIQDYADDSGDSASPAHSGSAVVTMGAGQSLVLFCFAAGDWTTASAPVINPIQVSVIELDSVSYGTLPGVATRQAPQRGH